MNTNKSTQKKSDNGHKALFTGGIAALLASACCMGPLLLITAGISGVWISKLSILEPYQPIFIGIAIVALFFAARRIWRPANECMPGELCAVTKVKKIYKVFFLIAATLLLAALFLPSIASYFY